MGLSSSVMVGFRLAPGPIPENYRFFEIQPGDSALLNCQEANDAEKSADNALKTGPTKQKRLKRTLEDFEGIFNTVSLLIECCLCLSMLSSARS